MAAADIDLATWPRAEAFRLFRSYAQPHFSLTTRADASRLMTLRKAQGVSAYRACLYAIGAGFAAVPDLRVRFRGDRVLRHDRVDLSPTVPRPDGSFGFAYLGFDPDFDRFDAQTATALKAVEGGATLPPNTGERDDLVYVSCLPWVDFTSVQNALPGPGDCIPRVSWGRIVDHGGGRHDFALAIEVHHAIADGAHAGAFFGAVQEALATL